MQVKRSSQALKAKLKFVIKVGLPFLNDPLLIIYGVDERDAEDPAKEQRATDFN